MINSKLDNYNKKERTNKMNNGIAEIIVAAIKKSLAAFNEGFGKPKEKTVQILKQTKTEQTVKSEYTGPGWFPEAKIHQLQKQAEGEKLEAALNSLSDSQMVEVVKAVSKQPTMNCDYWYKQPTGIFI